MLSLRNLVGSLNTGTEGDEKRAAAPALLQAPAGAARRSRRGCTGEPTGERRVESRGRRVEVMRGK